MGDGGRGRQHDGHQERSQCHKGKRNAVDPEIPGEPPGLVPDRPLDHLKTGFSGHERAKDEPGQGKGANCHRHSEREKELLATSRQQRNQKRPGRRQQDQGSKQLTSLAR